MTNLEKAWVRGVIVGAVSATAGSVTVQIITEVW